LLAAIRFDQRRWQDALTAAEQGLQNNSGHVGCTNLRAMALVKLGRRQEAGASIDVALAKNPENAITQANQGWTLLEKGDYTQWLPLQWSVLVRPGQYSSARLVLEHKAGVTKVKFTDLPQELRASSATVRVLRPMRT
jgi:tetratricopeptide (TPR) repeat protein